MIPRWFYKALLLLAWPAAQAETPPPGGWLAQGLDYQAGRAIFEKIWVGAPSSTTASDGLGPRYNARACAGCHPGAGRGRPLSSRFLPYTDPSLVLHFDDGEYGRQLQPFAVPGLAGEGRLELSYRQRPVGFPDGTRVWLREPHYRVTEAKLDEGARLSPRLAPPLHGVGALERLPEAAIAAWADPADEDRDGISGRLAGRFGWQGEHVSLADQVAAAMHRDMGLGSPLRPDPYGDCVRADRDCRALPDGNTKGQDDLEVSRRMFDLLMHYVTQLAPPAAAAMPEDSRGAALFHRIGCAACHRPAFETGAQTLRPYTDLLLHDMGPGLADRDGGGRPLATEWRTPPLWGGGAGGPYLHDGRAETLLEAVLWHGGEAGAAQAAFKALAPDERHAVLDFLSGL